MIERNKKNNNKKITSSDSSGHYSLLLTTAEKVENLNSWHNFLFVVFTPQTSSCGPERWVGSTMKTMFHQRNCKRHR